MLKDVVVFAALPEIKNSAGLQGRVVITVDGAQMLIDKTLAGFRLRLPAMPRI